MMAEMRKGTEKRHNPVESICRKIKAIQRREAASDPAQQISKYRTSSFESPWVHSKKVVACFPVPTSPLASLDKVAAFISCPEVASPGTPVLPAFSTPESEMSSVHPPRFENSSEWALSTKCRHLPGLAQRRDKLHLDEDLDSCCTERSSSTFVIDPGSASGQNPDCWSPQELVVMRLSLNDDAKHSSVNIGSSS